MRRNAISGSLRELSSHGHTCTGDCCGFLHRRLLWIPRHLQAVSVVTELGTTGITSRALAQAGLQVQQNPMHLYNIPSLPGLDMQHETTRTYVTGLWE